MALSVAPRWARLVAIGVGLGSAGCSAITDSFETNEFSGDPFPIQVDTQSGAVIVGLRQAGVPDRTAVLDLLSPFTIVDSGADIAPSVGRADLLVLGQAGPGGPLERPRARLSGAQLLSLHPCDTEPCVVGPVAAPRPFDAIVGADVLAGDAVRLRLGDDQLYLLADIGGDEQRRTRACDGVFPAPYRGGGTLVLGGTELPFGGRRIALQTCLGANPDPTVPQSQRGADALFVVSTGVGISIIGASAYERYRLAIPGVPALETLPVDVVNLSSGPISGHLGTISNLALVARSTQNPRAACRQVYASHLMVQRSCQAADDCPCEGGPTFCSTPAVHELSPPAGIAVLIVSDAEPTLQALRAELRPGQAEVDGILGTDALRSSELDVDYPHNRVLTRCTINDGSAGCITRPALSEPRDRTQVRGCLQYVPPRFVF